MAQKNKNIVKHVVPVNTIVYKQSNLNDFWGWEYLRINHLLLDENGLMVGIVFVDDHDNPWTFVGDDYNDIREAYWGDIQGVERRAAADLEFLQLNYDEYLKDGDLKKALSMVEDGKPFDLMVVRNERREKELAKKPKKKVARKK